MAEIRQRPRLGNRGAALDLAGSSGNGSPLGKRAVVA
jgi:hypothetical protein